jgi:Flp pilus assembly protein TadG
MNGYVGLASRQRSFRADQRGAVALEMPFVYFFLIFSLLFPAADLGIAGFQYISAWQALRAFGQYLQYNPPADVTNTASWSTSALAKADPSYPVSSIQVICGESSAACSATNTASPKYYSYTTTITLAPMVLKSVLCTSANTNPCTYTLPYSERFQ